MPFPAVDELVAILQRTTSDAVAEVRPVATGSVLNEMIGLVRQVPAASHLLEYASLLVVASHPRRPGGAPMVDKYVRFGASPRAAQAMVLAGKARALIEGRLNLAADDIRAVAPLALRHRLVLGYEAVADGVAPDTIIAEVLAAHPAPPAGA